MAGIGTEFLFTSPSRSMFRSLAIRVIAAGVSRASSAAASRGKAQWSGTPYGGGWMLVRRDDVMEEIVRNILETDHNQQI